MSAVPAGRLRALIGAQNEAIEAEIDRLEADARAHRDDLRQLDAELGAAWQNLIEVLAPGLHAPHLDWLAQLLHLPAVGAAEVARRLDDDRRALAATVAEITARPDYADRDGRFNEFEIHLTELAEEMKPLQESLATFRAEPLWDELYDVGYDTPRYPLKWWSFRYYRHWKLGDEIVERLGPRYTATTFDALRRRFDDERQALATLSDEWEGWRARKTALTQLVRTHDDALAGLENLETRHLTLVRARVEEHLRGLPQGDALALVDAFPPARVAMRRIFGVDAKQRYLREIHAEWIKAPLKDLRTTLAKNERQLVKLARPKSAGRTFDAAPTRFRDRGPAWEKRRGRYSECRDHILVFHDYDAYQPATTLWWDLMVGPAQDAPFIAEVAEWRQRRAPARDPYDDAVAAVASGHRPGQRDRSYETDFS